MDVGPAGAPGRAAAGEDAADLLLFVDRLAAAGPDDPTTTAAQEQISENIRAGAPPPGLRRLAEALAASSSEPPAPRHPVDDDDAVVSAMRTHTLVVLDDADPASVASAVAALIKDGRRVVVTAESDAELDAVRSAAPGSPTVDRLPALATAELRELRRLMATSTVAGRTRTDQQLPPPDTLPSLADVQMWCTQVARTASGAESLIPGLLADVEPERRTAVTSVARCVQKSLGALGHRGEPAWAWNLLGDLIHGRHRSTFDRTLEDIAQAAAVVDHYRGAPAVSFHGGPTQDTADVLLRYLEFLSSGGRARSYFRSSIQREVQPVLRTIRIGDRIPETAQDTRLVLGRLELDERMARVHLGCVEMSVPGPRGPESLAVLAEDLGRIAAAARSVGAFRHDVLFLGAESPVSVPDVDTAARIAAAICEYAEHGSAAEATARLDQAAAALADRAPVAATAPEHEQAVDALRAGDAQAYAAALDGLGAARREVRDETRRRALLERLREECPGLAAYWEESSSCGLGCFTRTHELLAAVPPPDSADVVVVLGAAQLGVERLLLAAVAPRMIAVTGPDERDDGPPTVLSVLRRASALVIQGRAPRSNGRVVRLAPAAGRPVVGTTAMGQAGA